MHGLRGRLFAAWMAAEIKRRIAKDGIKLVRLAWADPRGAARTKLVTVPVFLSALENGYNINVAPEFVYWVSATPRAGTP